MDTPVVKVEGLSIEIDSPYGRLPAVTDVSFQIPAGCALGLVGESGSGKSLTALAIPRLVRPPVRIASGAIAIAGRAVTDQNARDFRGREVGFVFQEPMTALNPVFTVGDQVGEALRVVGGVSRRDAAARVTELFRQVGISAPGERLTAYPHELSGGLRQRAVIAMALALSPRLLIADEPTTALDVTLQKQILALLSEQMRTRRLALLLISHDLGVVAEIADTVAVIYLGHLMEAAPARDLFDAPLHPYTRGLLDAMPRRAHGAAHATRLTTIPGNVPSLQRVPSGCRFRDRCALAIARCAEPVDWREASPDHFVRCVRAGE